MEDTVKKLIVVVVALAVLGGGAWYVMGRGGAGPAAPGPDTEAALPPVKADNRVQAEARVVPVRYAALSMAGGGIVDEVLVTEGEAVAAGQPILRIESAQAAASVAQAEAGLRRAQAQLDLLRAGARPEEVVAAQAAVDVAQAQLARLTESTRPEEIGAAEAALGAAQAALDETQAGRDEDETTIAAAELRRTEIALQQAQWAYDAVKYAADVGASPEAAQLEQATLAYESARSGYNLAVRGANDAEVAAAHAQLAEAGARLAALQQGATPGEVAAAQAEIRRAQAQLELARAGARREEVAVAEAEVAAAEATVSQARAALADTELRAPFAGTVAALDVRPGEQVAPGAPVARLADLSAWQIETDDLTELGVVAVKPGAPVTISVDAIPDLELQGRVVSVQPLGESKRGDITYRVVIQPERQDERLRWNMTTAVSIEGMDGAGVARAATGAQ